MLPIKKARLDMLAADGRSLGTGQLVTLVEVPSSAEGLWEATYKGFVQKWAVDVPPLSLSEPSEQSWESCFTPGWRGRVSWEGAAVPCAR